MEQHSENWSDARKWAMGIVGAVIVALLVAVVNHFTSGSTDPQNGSASVISPAAAVNDPAALAELNDHQRDTASVKVLAASRNRVAAVRAVATAISASREGCMNLVVTGLDKICESGKAGPNPSGLIRTEVSCETDVPANTSRTIVATAPNGGAIGCRGTDAQAVDLWVDLRLK